MNIESVLLYLLTWLLVALTPGPAVICIMSRAARYGTKARIPWSCGHTNWQPHFFPVYRVRAGDTIGSLINAFVVLQIGGAAYLVGPEKFSGDSL